jgi:hypothetical protein
MAVIVAVSGAARSVPPPVITGMRPNPIVSMSNLAIVGVELQGRNFWPSGPNNPDRRVLMVRRLPLPFQTMTIKNIGDTHITMEFPSLSLLNGAGQLEFMVKIDGVPSNVFAVKIVADPPQLASVMPDKIALGGGSDDPRWKVWLAGERWTDPTTIWIDGAKVGACFNYGRQEFTWPAPLRRAGTYQVQLRTEHGGSEVRTVQVLAPTPAYNVVKGSTAAAAIKALATPTPVFAIAKPIKGGAAAALLKATPSPTPASRRVIVP